MLRISDVEQLAVFPILGVGDYRANLQALGNIFACLCLVGRVVMGDNSVSQQSGIDPSHRINTLEELRDWFRKLSDSWVVPGKPSRVRGFAFRGQASSSWKLSPTLYRVLENKWRTDKKDPNEIAERELLALEKAVMVFVHRRGLHHIEQSRLSFMHQLAYLQHYGGPTRLIDVTFDPNIALWFSANGSPDEDSRIYAFGFEKTIAGDPKTRLLAERSKQPPFRNWEDERKCPWSQDRGSWCEDTWIWNPAHLDRRMAAQQGGFLLGGIATGQSSVSKFESKKTVQKKLSKDNARKLSCFKLNWHVADQTQWRGKGKAAIAPNFTLVIDKRIKKALRLQLEGLYGVNHSRLFPDYAGMATWLQDVSPAAEDKLPGEVWERFAIELQELKKKERPANPAQLADKR
jgi:hypothetical protein